MKKLKSLFTKCKLPNKIFWNLYKCCKSDFYTKCVNYHQIYLKGQNVLHILELSDNIKHLLKPFHSKLYDNIINNSQMVNNCRLTKISSNFNLFKNYYINIYFPYMQNSYFIYNTVILNNIFNDNYSWETLLTIDYENNEILANKEQLPDKIKSSKQYNNFINYVNSILLLLHMKND